MIQLRSLGFSARLGITLLCLVFVIGFAASAGHLFYHDHKRDERPGLTVDDVQGVYHGIRSRAPMLVALEANHPETLPAEDRQRLISWLNGTKLNEEYDNLDLGENAPAEIIARNCISCHARNSSDDIAKKMPLEFFDDVRKVAVSRDIQPNSIEIVTASTHTHALSLATLSFVLIFLILGTRFKGGAIGMMIFVNGFGLLADIGGWWLTRSNPDFAKLIIAGGACYFISSLLMLLLVVIDLWLPLKTKKS
jgi:hypothetical protein